MGNSTSIDRRGFLKRMATVGAGATATAMSGQSLAIGLFVPASERTLKLYNTHTFETLDVTYWKDGYYSETALKDLNHFMRDFRAGEQIQMDCRLYDLMWDIQYRTGTSDRISIISGYRSPKTNAALRERSGGVAQKSYHIVGRAIDIRIKGYDTRQIRNIAKAMNVGGVGYYSGSDFVHIDTGPLRSWG